MKNPSIHWSSGATYFNVAPEDQWIDGFFNGDESFKIKGMHPEKKILSSRLPGIKSLCFINQKTKEGEAFKEIKTSLDTAWIFPHAEKGVIIWRGVAEIQTDDADDIRPPFEGFFADINVATGWRPTRATNESRLARALEVQHIFHRARVGERT